MTSTLTLAQRARNATFAPRRYQICLIHPFDPRGKKVGGLETYIRDFITFHPADTDLLFIGVDSAPMHIAAAVGTPVVAMFGPSGDLEWAPWPGARESENRVIVSDQHPCRPCGLDGCGGGKVSDCLVSLPPAQVFEAALTLLSTVQHRPLPSGR